MVKVCAGCLVLGAVIAVVSVYGVLMFGGDSLVAL